VSGGDTVAVTTSIENNAEDHRLRTWLPTGIKTETVISDGQFLLCPRPIKPPRGDDWEQPHPGTYPQQEWSLVQDEGGRGLAVIAEGLPEIAPRVEKDGAATLQLTLLRAVGWLSRDDFPTRRNTNAGPTLATPEAQCPGLQTFHYHLAPLADGLGDLRRRSRQALVPIFTRQGVAEGSEPGAWLLKQTNEEVVLSALRRHPVRDTLVVRLWNQTAVPQEERLQVGLPVSQAWALDLLEERQDSLNLGEVPTRVVSVDLPPHRIVTVELNLDRSL